MFREELSHFVPNSLLKKGPEISVDAKFQYEFTMAAIRIGGAWYVLVEGPDESRISDIDQVIIEEFEAKITGWCVLREYQQIFGKLLPFSKAKHEPITLYANSIPHWLLKIKPNPRSRLNQFARQK